MEYYVYENGMEYEWCLRIVDNRDVNGDYE